MVRNRGGQLLVHSCDSGSATLPEVCAFPVAVVVDNIELTVEDRILRVFLSPRDKLKDGCHCENRKAISCNLKALIYWSKR